MRDTQLFFLRLHLNTRFCTKQQPSKMPRNKVQPHGWVALKLPNETVRVLQITPNSYADLFPRNKIPGTNASLQDDFARQIRLVPQQSDYRQTIPPYLRGTREARGRKLLATANRTGHRAQRRRPCRYNGRRGRHRRWRCNCAGRRRGAGPCR